LRLAAFGLAGIATLLLGLWLARLPLLEWAVVRSLNARDLGPAAASLVRLDLAGAELNDVSFRLGSISRIVIDYDLAGLLRGRIERAEIAGARLQFPAGEPGLRIGPEKPDEGANGFASSEPQQAQLFALPVELIVIRDASAAVETPRGPLRIGFDGQIRRDAGFSAELNLALAAAPGTVSGRLEVEIDAAGHIEGRYTIDEGRIESGAVTLSGLVGHVAFAGAPWTLDRREAALRFDQLLAERARLEAGTIDAHFAPKEGRADLVVRAPGTDIAAQVTSADFNAGADFMLRGTLAADVIGAFLESGSALDGSLRFDIAGRMPPLASLPPGPAQDPRPGWRGFALEGTVDLALTHFLLPRMIEGRDVSGALALEVDEDSASLTLADALTVHALHLAPEFVAHAPYLEALAAPFDLALEAEKDIPLMRLDLGADAHGATLATRFALDGPEAEAAGTAKATLAFDDALLASLTRGRYGAPPPGRDLPATGRFALAAESRLRIGERLSAEVVRTTLSGQFRLDRAALELAPIEGRFEGHGLSLAKSLTLPGATTLTLDARASRFTLERPGGTVMGSLGFKPLALEGDIALAGRPSQRVQMASESAVIAFGPHAAKLDLENGRIALPGYGVSADGIDATLALEGGRARLEAGVAALRHTADPPLLAPLGASLEARGDRERVDFSILVRDPAQRLELTISGHHSPAAGGGEASIALAPLELGPDGAGLFALSPAAASLLGSADGSVALEGRHEWGAQAGVTDLALHFDDVALTHESLGLSQLEGTLRLDGLAPPTTPPAQRLAFTLELARLGRVPLDVAYRIEPQVLVIEGARAELLGGAITTENARYDAGLGTGRLDLQLMDVELAAIAGLIDLEELQGSGRLRGIIPVRLEGNRIAIEKGRLDAAEPGTLRIASDILREQLTGRGDSVELMLNALADFRYERLSIDIAKPFEGEGFVLLHMEGANPEVLEGYPFVFNIRLSADFDRLTRVLREALGVASRALSWGVGRRGP